ncbi:MAG: transcriptional regulator [Myxococcota bacterium]
MVHAGVGVGLRGSDGLTDWMARSGGNRGLRTRLERRFGADSVRRAVDDGWVEARVPSDGEVLVAGCGCGGDLEAVVDEHGIAWLCADGFCPPVEEDFTSAGVVVADPVQLAGRIARALGLRWGALEAGVLGERRFGGRVISLVAEWAAPERVSAAAPHGEVVHVGRGEDTDLRWARLLRVGASGAVEVDLEYVGRRLGLSGEQRAELLAGQVPLVVLAGSGLVWVGGERVRLGPRAAPVLELLVERSGEWVSHEELMLAGWPDEVTRSGKVLCGEERLKRRLRGVVTELRSALGRQAKVEGTPGFYRLSGVDVCRVGRPASRQQ